MTRIVSGWARQCGSSRRAAMRIARPVAPTARAYAVRNVRMSGAVDAEAQRLRERDRVRNASVRRANDGAADDDPVRQLRRRAGMLRAVDAEADAHGQRRRRPQPRSGSRQLRRQSGLLAGDTEAADEIDESAA